MSKYMRKITYYENVLEFKENTKEELNITEINNWELCRTCLIDTSEDDVHMEKMSIMDVMQGSFLNIQEMLVETTNIQITENENFPLKVCKECFNKITALYYFSIQVRKADKVLRRLANKLNGYRDENEPCESELNFTENELPEDSVVFEVEEVFDCPQDLEIVENIANDENKTASTYDNTDETEEIKEISDFVEKISEIETELLKKDENLVDLKSKTSDDIGDLEKDLFEALVTSDGDNEETFQDDSTATITTTITAQKVKTAMKNPKKRARNAIPMSGYKHKQPRVSSPLLTDFTCAICHAFCERQQDLVYHVRVSHPNSKAYKCRVCGNFFSHIQSLSRHMNSHKEAVVLHECEFCSRPFVRLDDLKRHLRIHTGERPYVCSICDKAFQQQFELKYHKEKHLNGSKELQPIIFPCTECENNYTSRGGLYLHKKKRHGQNSDGQELVYDCSFCEQSFHYKSELKRHTRKHFLNEIIKCSECDEAFTSPSAFYSHKKKHRKSDSPVGKESEKENEKEEGMEDEEKHEVGVEEEMDAKIDVMMEKEEFIMIEEEQNE